MVEHEHLEEFVGRAQAAQRDVDQITRGPLKARWVVTAGLLPGEVMPAYTRMFELSAAEWQGGRAGTEGLFALEAAASAYARHLQLNSTVGRGVNWTRVEFVWI